MIYQKHLYPKILCLITFFLIVNSAIFGSYKSINNIFKDTYIDIIVANNIYQKGILIDKQLIPPNKPKQKPCTDTVPNSVTYNWETEEDVVDIEILALNNWESMGNIRELKLTNRIQGTTDSLYIRAKNALNEYSEITMLYCTIPQCPKYEILVTDKTKASCNPDATLTVEVKVNGNSYDFRTILDNKIRSQINENPITFTKLDEGPHSLYVKDIYGCQSAQQNEIIERQGDLMVNILLDTLCNDQIQAKVVLKSGLNPNDYQYYWDGNVNLSEQSKILSPNTKYSLSVRDGTPCGGSSLTIEIGDINPTLKFDNVVVKPASCFGSNDGSIQFFVSGGTPPYQVHFNGQIDDTDKPVYTNLSAGLYHFEIYDEQCKYTFETTIHQNPLIDFNIKYESSECFGKLSYNLFVEDLKDNNDLKYKWSNGSTDKTLNNIPKPGKYFLDITFPNGCTNNDTIILEPLQTTTIDSVLFDETCSGAKDGKISIRVNGNKNFLFGIDGKSPINQTEYANLSVGKHTLLITDGKSCMTTWDFNIKSGTTTTIELPNSLISNGVDPIDLIPNLIGNIPSTPKFIWEVNPPILGLCMDCPTLSLPKILENTHIKLSIQFGSSLSCSSSTETDIFYYADKQFFVPTAFSPNNDGINDQLNFYGSPTGRIIDLKIFNRQGTELFVWSDSSGIELNTSTFGWNGSTTTGINLPSDVYLWIARVKYFDGISKLYNGETHIIK